MRGTGIGRSRRTRALTAALVAALALSVFASAAQALPASFWGVVPQATPSEEQALRLKRGGVRSMRVPMIWSGIEASRGGPPDWTAPDSIVRAAAAGGMEILPFVTGAPNWAVPSVWVPGSGQSVKAPVRLPASGAAAGAWSSFLAQVVGRYGPNGDFWAENPTLSPRPAPTWQIW